LLFEKISLPRTFNLHPTNNPIFPFCPCYISLHPSIYSKLVMKVIFVESSDDWAMFLVGKIEEMN
jgi:hypothetical protein